MYETLMGIRADIDNNATDFDSCLLSFLNFNYDCIEDINSEMESESKKPKVVPNTNTLINFSDNHATICPVFQETKATAVEPNLKSDFEGFKVYL
jgi:hypothetical protein